jgi:type II secretory pathway pseudopilin PulG
MPTGDLNRRGRLPCAGPTSPARGFTYVGLLILLVVIGLMGATTLKADALLDRAARERELLETGADFSGALKSYADATPPEQPPYPPTLQELLKDPREAGVRRRLRHMPIDPVTGKAEWGIVWAAPDKRMGVLAVHSLSPARPLKRTGFDHRFRDLDDKEHLSDWLFPASGQRIIRPTVDSAPRATGSETEGMEPGERRFPVPGARIDHQSDGATGG